MGGRGGGGGVRREPPRPSERPSFKLPTLRRTHQHAAEAPAGEATVYMRLRTLPARSACGSIPTTVTRTPIHGEENQEESADRLARRSREGGGLTLCTQSALAPSWFPHAPATAMDGKESRVSKRPQKKIVAKLCTAVAAATAIY